jgi:hypothetical protein
MSYNQADLLDAPEHHEYSRAMGILTWGTWDHGVRPVEQRIKDFLAAYPPAEPVRHSAGGSLQRQADGTYAPGSLETRTQRFLSNDWRAASLHELLSRYGLKLAGAPVRQDRPFTPGAFRQETRDAIRRMKAELDENDPDR